LGYFESVLARNGRGKHLVGGSLSYADLSLFQVVAGLRYAFQQMMNWNASFRTPWRCTTAWPRAPASPPIFPPTAGFRSAKRAFSDTTPSLMGSIGPMGRAKRNPPDGKA
jgi:hypothetical protein